MRKLFYPLFMATMCVATACTNTKDDVINNNPTNKTPISFAVEESRAMTRAGFSIDTEIAMRIKSKNDKDSVLHAPLLLPRRRVMIPIRVYR